MRKHLKSAFICALACFLLFSGNKTAAYAENRNQHIKDIIIEKNVIDVLYQDGTLGWLPLPQSVLLNYGYEWKMPDTPELLQERLNWTDIVQIESCNGVLAGLHQDGTVQMICIENDGENEFRQLGNNSWDQVVELFGGKYNIFGLKEDGTVAVFGNTSSYNETIIKNVEHWRNVRKLFVRYGDTFGDRVIAIMNDGTLVSDSEFYLWDWTGPLTDIIDYGSGFICSGAVRADGSIVGSGETYWSDYLFDENDFKQISFWGYEGCLPVGLRKNGTIAASKDMFETFPQLAEVKNVEHLDYHMTYMNDGTVRLFDGNEALDEEIETWKDIKEIWLNSYYDDNRNIKPFALGLRENGTLVGAGIDMDALFGQMNTIK